MRLDQLHIQNFRCYEDATFKFQPGFNLVVGVNGSGKTSLLQAIAAALRDFTHGFKDHFTVLEEELVRFKIQKTNGRVRFERCYPLQIEAKGEIFDIFNWVISKKDNSGSTSSDHSLLEALRQQKRLITNEISTSYLPVVAYYKANRRWIVSGVSAESAASQKSSRLSGYDNWFDAAANLQEFESWFITKTLERLEAVANTPEKITDFRDELSVVNGALKKAIPDSLGLRYDISLRSLMLDLSSTNALPFETLSDGQRAMIALIADIARRACLLNPQIENDTLALTKGIVIIDELDIHLHPAWQRNIVKALKDAFPRIQFIAASHSPQIIGGLTPEEIMLLDNGHALHPRVSYGLDSSRVLEEVMGVPERAPEIEALINQLFETIENNELDAAKNQLHNLEERAPDLPEFAGARALIRRKELVGK